MSQPFTDFWVDAGVMAATDAWKEQARERQQAAQTDAGVATPSEKADLVDAQDARAERREQDGQPSPQEQLAALKGDD